MPQTQEQYTYRAGQKIRLEKSPNQFVVRALPEPLEYEGENLVVLFAGDGVDDMETLMTASHHVAPMLTVLRRQ